MKAIVTKQYGSPDVLHMQEVETPVPKADEVLVSIHAASVNAVDWHILRADPFLARLNAGMFTPKYSILGADVAGTVEAVGPNVTQFKPGDEVYGDLTGCGFGGYAEYVAAPERFFAPKPARLTFEEAAAVPLAACTALQALRDAGGVQPGQQVLIHGASGGVGTYAVQIAKRLGAEVTAVCSTGKIDMVRSLGADHVIDYTREDFAQHSQQYDLIVAANGNRPLRDYQRALKPDGVYVMVGGSNKQIFQALLLGPLYSLGKGQKFGPFTAKPNSDDLRQLTAWIDAGEIAPVIDRRFSLAQVPDAIRYLEDGHARGKIVITHGQN
jgi:NADPH:quinone reductase-like Zn-dependent oxidoreductase